MASEEETREGEEERQREEEGEEEEEEQKEEEGGEAEDEEEAGGGKESRRREGKVGERIGRGKKSGCTNGINPKVDRLQLRRMGRAIEKVRRSLRMDATVRTKRRDVLSNAGSV